MFAESAKPKVQKAVDVADEVGTNQMSYLDRVQICPITAPSAGRCRFKSKFLRKCDQARDVLAHAFDVSLDQFTCFHAGLTNERDFPVPGEPRPVRVAINGT